MTKESNNKLMDELKKKFRKDFFRCQIWGASQCGKTYFLTNILLPEIIKQYDEVIVFTRSHNNKYYKKALNKLKKNITIINEDFIDNLNKIRKMQEDTNNIKKFDKDGNPEYNVNLLIIFDDIIREKDFRNDDFLDLFTNFRHLQCSTILISQIVNHAITTQMKANTNIFVMFRLGHYKQRSEIIKLIEEALMKEAEEKEIKLEPPVIKRIAKSIYHDNITSIKYGYVATDDGQILYLPNMTDSSDEEPSS
jgi:hypothetical protein